MSGSGVTVIDGLGREVTLARPPRRIVSLVPSTTESLAAIGAADRVVGRTRYCVHPEPWVRSVPAVGGTKDPDFAAITALRPDLVLANEEENKPAFWPELEAIAPLYVASPRTVDDALEDLATTGRLVGERARADELVARIESVRPGVRGQAFRFAYLVWRRPWMVAGDDTFTSRMLGEVGGVNAFARSDERYPQVTLEALCAADPDVVLLSTEPFPFTADHAAEFGPLAPRCRVVDGELACWHGARMLQGLPYLQEFFGS